MAPLGLAVGIDVLDAKLAQDAVAPLADARAVRFRADHVPAALAPLALAPAVRPHTDWLFANRAVRDRGGGDWLATPSTVHHWFRIFIFHHTFVAFHLGLTHFFVHVV